MKRILLLMILTPAFLMNACKEQIKYPETRKTDTVDVYFGVSVPDPYRWLEDDNSEETGAWVKAQNAVTEAYLAQIPYRQKIRERLTEIWDYPKYGTPFKEGGRYFYYKNDGLQPQSVLYKLDSIDAEPIVLLDPNTFSEDGTIALSNISFSTDGSLLAYSTSEAGSDWKKVFLLDVASGEQLADELDWIKFSGMAWYGKGFFYTRYDEPAEGDELKGTNENTKVFYHLVGTPQSQDIMIYSDPANPRIGNYLGTSEDESYMFLYRRMPGTQGNSLFFKKAGFDGDFIPIVEGYEHDFNIVDNVGDSLLVYTNYKAPKYRILVIDAKNPAEEFWTELIPESEDVLQGASILGGKLLTTYLKDASSRAYFHGLDGSMLHEVSFQGLGSLGGFSGKRNENEAFYTFTSFTFPPVIYRYDIANNSSEVFRESEIDFNTDEYETRQVFYESKDGTRVPMFIVHKKGIELNGKNPTLLYGYGGFNISLTPSFSISNLVFLENGGVYAMANLRGGGEYGEDWHLAGTLLQKQNVFDDFIAAAEYLIDEGYTSPSKLAIRGGSNGGLLVGACMTQRPDLFKVALPAVGVMDMLRYHKFTIGYFWASDYGTSEDSAQFNYLYKYSPLHNLKEGTKYPATLITTADHDDRVVPAHSFKFAAALQAAQKGSNPTLIRIEERAGHGAGKPTQKIIDEATDIWSFTFWNLGIEPSY